MGNFIEDLIGWIIRIWKNLPDESKETIIRMVSEKFEVILRNFYNS